ncbi:CASP C terminal-domain-containing protein [Paraphysoderma sedebokerense]|nr:CASP C terminal-domain-containing protein [Paraphysoderma sedebokerense]
MDQALTRALHSWQALNLPQLIRDLTSTATEVVENQKQGQEGRRKLAEQTKDFKKLPDDQKLLEFKNLLKGYQNEIDSLTKRSKFSETAFLDVFKSVSEAPDPAPLLSHALDQSSQVNELSSIEKQNKELRNEIENLNEQIQNLRIQEGQSAKLQSKLTHYETKMEELIRDKLAARETEIKAEYEEKSRIFKDREHTLERQLDQAKQQLQLYLSTHEDVQAKLIDHSQKYSQEVAAKLAELEFVTSDLEKANRRINQLERELHLSRSENESIKLVEKESGQGASQLLELEQRCTRQEMEITKLHNELDIQRNLLSQKSSLAGETVDSIQNELNQKTEENEKLRTALEQRSDYEQIRKELQILKFVEFADMPESTDSVPLERLLLSKNKKLENELTALKVEHSRLTELHNSLTSATQANSEIIQKQKTLIAKLEDDLIKLGQVRAQNGSMSGQLWANDIKSPEPESPNLTSDSSVSGSDSSMVKILTGQRDRFKSRNAELEEQVRQHLSTISDLRHQLSSLQEDNVNLYQKIKYLQSYPGTSNRNAYDDDETGATFIEMNDDPKGVGKGHIGTSSGKKKGIVGILKKYRDKYEERLNPFRMFHQQEQSLRYSSLTTTDKATLSISKLLLSNKYTRNFLFVYTILLHALVLGTIYSYSLRDENCGSGAASNGVDPPGN